MSKAILDQVESFYGSKNAMAEKLGVWAPNVYGWFSGVRPVPALAALMIECDTKGKLKAEKVSPTQVRKIATLRSVVAQLIARGYATQAEQS